MRFPALVPGRFVRRDNRFRATVRVDGEARWAHVANSGRLLELFQPERPVWLAPAARPGRKTDYDLKLVEHAGVLVSVDARLPNPLFAEALTTRRWPAFDYDLVEREVTLGQSRLDFRLSGPTGVCWVETKSVTLVEEGVALFPDAPTIRGQRHLSELTGMAKEGDQAAVVFIIQRPDATQFKPHNTADPAFTAALQAAAASGVSVRAFTCQVSLAEIGITVEIPVRMS
ncbi:MAG: DNA/RNA nuclease SfsA [Candidatus Promineifilaceae bacterium]|nr:DNA/RNA nuclease SfsA [Candidatus Promineifilaceae bacterium]